MRRTKTEPVEAPTEWQPEQWVTVPPHHFDCAGQVQGPGAEPGTYRVAVFPNAHAGNWAGSSGVFRGEDLLPGEMPVERSRRGL